MCVYLKRLARKGNYISTSPRPPLHPQHLFLISLLLSIHLPSTGLKYLLTSTAAWTGLEEVKFLTVIFSMFLEAVKDDITFDDRRGAHALAVEA